MQQKFSRGVMCVYTEQCPSFPMRFGDDDSEGVDWYVTWGAFFLSCFWYLVPIPPKIWSPGKAVVINTKHCADIHFKCCVYHPTSQPEQKLNIPIAAAVPHTLQSFLIKSKCQWEFIFFYRKGRQCLYNLLNHEMGKLSLLVLTEKTTHSTFDCLKINSWLF